MACKIAWYREPFVRLAAWLCVFVISCTPFFTPREATAADLTDKEVKKFRALLEERKVEPALPGPLTDMEMKRLLKHHDIFEDITFGGYLANYFQYESVNPGAGDSVAINPKDMARQVKSFSVNNMQMWFYKEVPRPGDIGFKIVLDWGETARRMTSVGPIMDDTGLGSGPAPFGTVNPADGTAGDQETFKEGYVQWNVPIGTGLTVQFGKFADWLGYEWWETIWNPNFSPSYTDGWLVAGNGTGIGLGYNLTDSLTANYYFVNTTGTFVNNNKVFSHGVDFNYDLPETGFFKKGYVNVGAVWGRPFPNNTTDWLQTYDITFSFSPFERLTLATTTNWNYSSKRIVQPSGRAKRGNQAWGVAQYFIYEHNDWLGLALRGEYYWDQENLAGISGGDGASLTEVTGTINFKIREKVMIRPEIRYDKIISVPNGPSHIWHRQNKNITGLIGMSYEF